MGLDPGLPRNNPLSKPQLPPLSKATTLSNAPTSLSEAPPGNLACSSLMCVPKASQATQFLVSCRLGLSSHPHLNPFSPEDQYCRISLHF